MQAFFIASFLLSVLTATSLIVVHYRRANRELAGELNRYARMESQLRDSEARYRTLFELAPVGCVVWEPGFRVTEWNDRAERIFGWTREEMIGRNLYDAVLEDTGLKARQAMASLFADGMPSHTVSPMVTKDGRTITCEWRNAVLRSPDGRPAKIVSVCTDITRQKAQERELAMFRALVELTEDPMVSIVNPKNGGRFAYVNDACCRHYGMSREELLAVSPADLDSHFDSSRGAALVEELEKKKTVRFETKHRTATGELIPVEVLLNWFEHDGEALVAHYVRDTRERKSLEAEKIRYEAEAARWESEQRLVSFASSAPGLMFITRLGADGNISMPYASQALQDVFGLQPEDVAESLAPVQAAIHPDDRALVAETIENSARTLSLCNVEFRIAHPEKGEIWVEARSIPTAQPDGSILWHGFMLDVTRRKRADELLHAQEQEFRTLVEHSPDVIVRYDRDCRRLYANPTWERVNGISVEDILGKSPEEQAVAVAPFASEYQEKLRAVIVGGQPADIDLSWPDDEGRPVSYAMRAVPEFDEDGRVVSILTVARDITERKQTEEALAAREREYRSLAENLPDDVARWDTEGRYLYINPTHERTIGASLNEVIGQFIPDSHEQVKAAIAQVVETGEAIPFTRQPVPGENGEIRIHEVSLIPERNAQGEIVSVLGLGRDVTDQVRMQEALRAREAEFRTLAENSPDTIIRHDRECRRLYANPAVGHLTGKPLESLIGIGPDAGQIIVSEQSQKLMAGIRQVFDSGESVHVEIDFVAQNGEHYDYHMLLVPERGTDGQVATVLSLGHDVTAIREAERHLTRFVANLPGFAFSFRMAPDGSFSYPFASPGVAGIYGLTPEDVMNDAMLIAECIHPDDHPATLAATLESARALTPFHVEFRTRSSPGEFNRWAEVRSLPVCNADGGTTWHDITLDITERKRMEAELRQQADFRKVLLDAMCDVGLQLMMIENGRIVHVGNRELARRFGYGDAEIDGHPPLVDIVHPDDRARVMDYYRRRLAGEALPSSYDLGLVTCTGERREFEAAIAIVPGSDPLRIVTVGKDITERKRLEQDLKTREQEMRSLAENSPDYISRYGRDRRFLYLNAKLQANLGVDLADVKGKLTEEVWTDGRFADIVQAITAAVEQGIESTVELAAPVAHGECRYYQIRVVPERNDDGEIVGALAFGRDITERKRMETVLEDSLRFLTRVLDTIPDPIFVKDRQHRWMMLNQACCNLIGHPRDELLGKSDYDYFPEEQARVFWEADEAVFAGGREHAQEEEITDGDGAKRVILTRKTPSTDRQGQPILVGTITDITEIKQYESVLLGKAEAEARLTKLAATAPGIVTIFRMASDGRISIPYAAPGIVDVYGLWPEKLAQDASVLADRVHPDDLARIRESIAESASTLMPWHCEYRVQHPAKGELWIESHSVPEPGPDGDILWYGFVHDITKRKRVQRQFEMVNFALDNVEEAAFLVDSIWIVHANEGACRSLGYSNEEFKGMTVFDFTPDFNEALLDTIMHDLEENGRCVFETRHRSKDGGVFPVEVSVAEFHYQGREMRLFLARDITARKRMEDMLRAREQEFRALVENSPDTIARYGRDCRRIYANPALERLLGGLERDVLDKTPEESPAFSESATHYQETIKEVLESGREGEFSLNWQTGDGKTLWSHIRVAPEFSPDGEVVSVLAMGHDITELVEAEQRLKESRALLRKLTARREAEHEQERKRLAWEVFDTLGQILMVLRMDVSWLFTRFPDEGQPLTAHLRKMLVKTDRAIEVMKAVAYELRPVVLDMGLAFALEWLTGEFSQKTGIPCELLVGEEEIRLDETGVTIMFRIVQESLDNIAKHAEAGYVEIELKRVGKEYLLMVRDDGKGFDLDSPMENALGLIGIQERVHALGGETVLLSTPEQGTVLEVRVSVQ